MPQSELGGGTDALIASQARAPVINLRAQVRPRWPGSVHLIGSILSLLVIASVVDDVRGVNLQRLFELVPRSPVFWLLFAASYLCVPAADWLIFRRLWSVGPQAFGALLRKLIFNELLLGYLGEAYFYTWARRHLRFEAAPFGAVKDVAIMSAIAGNVVTMLMLAVAWPLASATQLGLQTRSVVLSLTVVLMTSMAALLWRRKIFTLSRRQLGFIFSVHIGRIVLGTLIVAALWHMILPVVPVVWWLLLSTIRLLISRLPFVPNKDVVFAGLAVFMLGRDVEIASLLTLMAGLIVLTHLFVGMACAATDLLHREEVR